MHPGSTSILLHTQDVRKKGTLLYKDRSRKELAIVLVADFIANRDENGSPPVMQNHVENVV